MTYGSGDNPNDFTHGRKRHIKLPKPANRLETAAVIVGKADNSLLFASVTVEGVSLYHSTLMADTYRLFVEVGGNGELTKIAESNTPWLRDAPYLHVDAPFGESQVKYYLKTRKGSGQEETIGAVSVDLSSYVLAAVVIDEDASFLNLPYAHLEWTWEASPGQEWQADPAELSSFQIERDTTGSGDWAVMFNTSEMVAHLTLASGSDTTQSFRIKAVGKRLGDSPYTGHTLGDGANQGNGPPDALRSSIEHQQWTKNLCRNSSFEILDGSDFPKIWIQSTPFAMVTDEWAGKHSSHFCKMTAGQTIKQLINASFSSSDIHSASVLAANVSGATWSIVGPDDEEIVTPQALSNGVNTLQGFRVPANLWQFYIVFSGQMDIDRVQINQGATAEAWALHSSDAFTDIYDLMGGESGSKIIQTEESIQLIVAALTDGEGLDQYTHYEQTADQVAINAGAITTIEGDLATANASISANTDSIEDNEGNITGLTATVNSHTTSIQQNATSITAAITSINQLSTTVNDPVTGLVKAHARIDLHTQVLLGDETHIPPIGGAETLISQHSTAITNAEGDIETLEARVVLSATVNSGVIENISLIRLDATILESSVTIQADIIDIIGVVNLINGGVTTIDGDKITTGSISGQQMNMNDVFVNEQAIVGPSAGLQFILDGSAGQIRTSDGRFLIYPKGNPKLKIVSSDSQIYTEVLSDGTLVVRNESTGNRVVIAPTQGIVQIVKGGVIRSELFGDHLEFYDASGVAQYKVTSAGNENGAVAVLPVDGIKTIEAPAAIPGSREYDTVVTLPATRINASYTVALQPGSLPAGARTLPGGGSADVMCSLSVVGKTTTQFTIRLTYPIKAVTAIEEDFDVQWVLTN